jgi:TnpA family transposase
MEPAGVDVDELIEFWTLLEEDRPLLAGKRGATALGFAVLLKHYTRHGRFPHGRSEVQDEVVAFVARQLDVAAGDLGFYEWAGSTIEYHRAQIRDHLGYRIATLADQEQLTGWLSEAVAKAERRPDRVREELLGEFRRLRIEPYRADTRGRERVTRMVYEVATFQALREQLRCKEIWVVGADSWRNPEEDLPADFEQRRSENYGELRKPLDPSVFIGDLRSEMTAALDELHASIPELEWLDITDRASGAITLPKYEAAPEPRNLRRIKAEVQRRWGTVALIDILKETVLRTGCLTEVSAVAGSGTLPVEVLAERLMLAVYAYGTNTGIRAVAAGGGHGHSEDEIRYVRRRYLTRATAQAVAIGIANATFAARQHTIWGEGSTAVASDSTHFRSYDQNIFTEWHSRYGGRGILIYWHVERGSMVVHSQTLRASASEVHAMVEGAIRHGTTMTVEGNYVDTHGQSEIGFGITRLLGFDLLPRIKQINKVRLYRPATGQPDSYPQLAPALTRPIRWDLVEQNYDQMIKYATAIRQGTASTEAILRRFTRSASHPTYQAMLEVGRAQRTIFVARYLRSRELQREITEGLNVVEAFNGANSVIYYGKGGEIASNRQDEQEMTVLCLRILQAALVYVNTLMLQDVLTEDEWSELLTPEDRRGLTPLFWQHVLPYGEVKLDMTARLSIRTAATSGTS